MYIQERNGSWISNINGSYDDYCRLGFDNNTRKMN